MMAAGPAMQGAANLNDSLNGSPPGSAGMNQAGMPGTGNSAQGAMDMQKANTMAGAVPQSPSLAGGPSAPPADAGMKEFMGPPSSPPQPEPHPGQLPQSPVMDLADQTINSTPPADGLLSNPRTQQTINNANGAIGLGATVNSIFQPGNPPSPGGFPARPFQMPNSVLGLRSVFGR